MELHGGYMKLHGGYMEVLKGYMELRGGDMEVIGRLHGGHREPCMHSLLCLSMRQSVCLQVM